MASITIRNLDDSLKRRLRLLAAEHGHSMEEEARQLLRAALEPRKGRSGLGTRIWRRFAKEGGVELPAPERHAPRDAPLSDDDE